MLKYHYSIIVCLFISEVQAVKKPAWLKQRKGGGKKSNKKSYKSKNNFKSNKAEGTPPPVPKTKVKEEKCREIDSDESDVSENNDRSSEEEVKSSSVEDDDQEWEKFQQKIQKREKLEGKSKTSHSVHCPLFPLDKQEYWWTYICDRKSRTLLTAPYNVTGLVDREDCQLKVHFASVNLLTKYINIYILTVCEIFKKYVQKSVIMYY